MANTNIYTVRYINEVIQETIPAEIVGNSNRATILRIESNFSSPENTMALNFAVRNGVIVKSAPFVTQVTIDDVVFFRYEYSMEADVTAVERDDATTLRNVSPVVTNVATGLTTNLNVIELTINQNVDGTFPPIPIDDVTRLDARIDDKRDRNPTSLTSKVNGNTRLFTSYDTVAGNEVKETFEELREELNLSVIPKNIYPTTTDTTRTDPVLSQFFKFNVDSRTDPNYNPTEQIITLTPTAAGVGAGNFENLASFLYPVGFFDGTFTDVNFSTTLVAKKTGGNGQLRIDYLKIDTSDVETLQFTGNPFTVSTDVFDTSTKSGSISSIEADASALETIVARIYVNVQTLGDDVSFKVGGETSFTSFELPAGSSTANKKDKNFGAVGGKLLQSQTDGNDLETVIDVIDVARLSQTQTFTNPQTYNDLITMLNGLTLTGDLTIDGQLFVLNGNATEILTTELEIEDLIATYAKGNILSNIQTGHEWEIGASTKWAITRDVDGEFRFGLTTNKKILAAVQDSPTANVGVFNPVLKLFETQTPLQVKTLLSLENVTNKSELDLAISNATQNALNDKLTALPIFDTSDTLVGNAKSLKFTGGVTMVQVNDQVSIDVQGVGIGEGIIDSGQVSFDAISPVPAVETILDVNVVRQSSDETVFRFFDKNDTPTNVLRIFKTATVELANKLFYQFKVTGNATNTDNALAHTLTFTIKRNSTIVQTIPVPISQATAAAPQTNNFTIIGALETNPLDNEEDYQVFITADAAGFVTLNSLQSFVDTSFVSGEALSQVMRTGTFATNGTNKVDHSLRSDRGQLIQTTNPQDADLEYALIGGENVGDIFEFEVPNTLTSANVTITETTGPNTYDLFEEDGTTPITGTNINDKKISVARESTYMVLKQITTKATNVTYDNSTSGLTATNVQTAIDELQAEKGNKELVLQNSQAISKMELALKADSLITDLDNRGTFGNDFVADINFDYTVDKFQEVLKSNYPATTTVITDLTDTTGLLAGMTLTVQDTLSKEEVTIVSVDSGTQITISALVNSYTTVNSSTIYRSYINNIEQWTKRTEMNVLPDSDGWTADAGNNGSAVITSGILNITTTGLQKQNYIIESGNIVAANTKRIDSRLKVNSNSGTTTSPSQVIALGDGVKQFVIMCETDKITIFNNTTSPTLAFTGDMTSFRKIRIEMDNVSGAKLFVDDNLEFSQAYASIFTAAINNIRFGDLSPSVTEWNADIDYDYIYYQLDLGTNADVELLGTDSRTKIIANKTIEQDFIITEEESFSDAVVTIDKFVSMSNINTESFTALTEDTALEYISGSNDVKRYLGEVATAGSNIFLKTTTTKTLTTDTHNKILEYGQVVKL